MPEMYAHCLPKHRDGGNATRSLVIPFPRSAMAPKRARTAAAACASYSSSSFTAAPKLTLSGGVPHHPALAGLWRDERLTDFAVSAEGVEFKAHRVALASSSKYFLNLFESGTVAELGGLCLYDPASNSAGGHVFPPPTHNREPYDTRLSDTMVTHPSASS